MARTETRTGGRDATRGIIHGDVCLCVGNPGTATPQGFRWTPLSDVARLESGHTPARSHPEYWDGDIPWVGIRDATGNHGRRIHDTEQHVTQLGIDNSSARILPADTVCLSRTASVGYVVTMGVPMATSQDFVNWVCGPELNHRYLHFALLLEQTAVRERFAHGSTHQTMYYPEAKALHVLMPPRETQDAIAEVLGALDDKFAANEQLVSVSERLMQARVSQAPSEAAVSEVAEHERRSVSPSLMGEQLLSHYSLPAFDEQHLPVVEPATKILSGKFAVTAPCVLMSKLNPRFPRVWDLPTVAESAVASTEFVVLTPRGVSTSALWAALSQPRLGQELEDRAAGTSGSHQRVRPQEILSAKIPDPRSLAEGERALIANLGRRVFEARMESQKLAALRDTLLPELMSGRLTVKDVESQVEEVV